MNWNGPFEYAGLGKCESHCYLEIIENQSFNGGFEHIVVATESPDNKGTSITNAITTLINGACVKFGLEPSRIVWVEKYHSGSLINETLSMASFACEPVTRGGRFIEWHIHGIRWHHLTRVMFDKLIEDTKVF